jgi:lysophospholipase L1-like esterase
LNRKVKLAAHSYAGKRRENSVDIEKKKPLTILILVIVIFSGISMYSVALNASVSNDVRVACVGDSITAKSGYPQKLQALLGSNYTVANFGASGSTISCNSQLPYLYHIQFKRAVDFNPDIVLIMLGTNDANRELTYSNVHLEDDYTQLVTAFKSLPNNPKVIVVKAPPIFTSSDSAYNNTILVSNVNPRVESFAAQMNLLTVDMYAAFGDHADYFADGVHPTDDGASLIASTIYGTVTSLGST